jgi:hypothetical protein
VLLSTAGVPGPASQEPGKLQPPALETGAPTSVTSSSATLHGTVNPDRGEVVECHFDYGKTTSYGASIPCGSSIGAGDSPVPTSAALKALTGAGTYHFRIVATNGGGTSVGPDMVLTTP